MSHGIFTGGSRRRSIPYLRSVAVIDGDVYSNVISRPPTKITCLENVSHRYPSIFLLRHDERATLASVFGIPIRITLSWTSIDKSRRVSTSLHRSRGFT